MKYIATILILFVCSCGCKDKPKKEVVISNGHGGGGSGGVQSISDSSIGGYISSSGWALIDSNGLVIDSTSGDLWYKFNKKNVPLGFYSDTAIWHENNYDIIQFRVFIDRKEIFYTSFLEHGTEVWDVNVDSNYLKRLIKTKQ